MPEPTFPQQVRNAARDIARLEMRRRRARKLLEQLDLDYRRAQQTLRLLVQSLEPYSPPAPGSADAAQERIDGGMAR